VKGMKKNTFNHQVDSQVPDVKVVPVWGKFVLTGGGANNNNNTSVYHGVCWQKDRSKWLARPTINGKRNNKCFSTEMEAALWHDEQVIDSI
jgi:hypothetical protein